MKKRVLFGVAAAAMLTAGSAMAATVYSHNTEGVANQVNLFPTGTTTAKAYKIAYEVYSNTAGATTNAATGMQTILLAQPLVAGQNINLRVSNSSAVFNSAGTGMNRYGLCSVGVVPTNPCTAGAIVAAMPPSGVTTDNLGMQVTVGVTAGNYLRLVQWNDNNGDGDATQPNYNDNQLSAEEVGSKIEGASLWVLPGLNPTCTETKLVQMTFSTPSETTSAPYNFAYITPQYVFTKPTDSALNAELDTDLDFTRFVLNSGANVSTVTNINVANFYAITDSVGANKGWITYASSSLTGDVTYKLTSIAEEPGIVAGNITIDGGTACTATGTVWTCTKTGLTMTAAHPLSVTLNGTGENNPTNWTISDFVVSNIAGATALCYTPPTGSVGSWYGGIEAIVPFVKYNSATGYATYIKMVNRYTKAAKLYYANMQTNSASIISSVDQFVGKTEIPSAGMVEITGDDMLNSGKFTADQLNNGVPIKFLIRVPAQSGALTTGSIVDNTDTYPSTIGGTVDLNSALNVANLSQVTAKDPYITGVVVQVVPGGSQRSIPLMFKAFKQGQYN